MHPLFGYTAALSLLAWEAVGIACAYFALFPPATHIEYIRWALLGIGMAFEVTGLIFAVNCAAVVGAWWWGAFNNIFGKLSIPFIATFSTLLIGIYTHSYLTTRQVVIKEIRRMEGYHNTSIPLSSRLGVFDSIPISLPFFLQSVIPYWRPWDVMEHRDITYATPEELAKAGHHNERFMQLDVLHRASGPAKRPVFVYIHGGAWSLGDKRMLTMPICWYMASHNWVVVNINYRLSPHVNYPDHLIDAKRALRWVQQNIHRYGGDPDFVAVSGGSAGGHLASMVALTQNMERFQPGFEDVSTSIAACVAFYPVVDVTDNSGYSVYAFRNWFARAICGKPSYSAAETWLKENACPISAVPFAQKTKDGVPPFLVLQGDNDSLVPTRTVRHFVDELAQLDKNGVYYLELPKAHHAFDAFNSPRANVANWAVAEFLNAVHARGVGKIIHQKN